MRPPCRDMGDLLVKSIVWNIWLARNDCIFSANILPTHAFILKIDRMLLSWFSTVADGSRVKLEDLISSIRRSLKFLGPRVEEVVGARTRASSCGGSGGLRRPVFSSLFCFCVSSPVWVLFHCLWFLFVIFYCSFCFSFSVGEWGFSVSSCYLIEMVYPPFSKKKIFIYSDMSNS